MAWPDGIDAITLFTDDLEATRDFYTEVFGLPIFFEDDNSAVFKFGDTLINYRFQALTEGSRRPAFSPRLSVILPTGSEGVGYDARVAASHRVRECRRRGDRPCVARRSRCHARRNVFGWRRAVRGTLRADASRSSFVSRN